MDDKELSESMNGLALHSNRFVVDPVEAGVRIAFLEKSKATSEAKFRTAALVSYQDAVELKNLLARILEPIENQMAEYRKSLAE